MRKTPKVLGTLSIVFGALVACWSPLSLLLGSFMKGMMAAVAKMPQPAGGPDPSLSLGATEAILNAQRGFTIGSAIVMTLMSVALIVIGVGLVKRRPWSRRAAISWSLVALVIVVAQSVTMIAWVQPMTMQVQRAYYEAHGAKVPFELPRAAAAGSGMLGALFNAAFPTVMLVLLGRRSAAADFTG
jgi:hypothetical protein